MGPAESPFEDAVIQSLEAMGWQLRTQVGVSLFRIDIGVVHPDFAGAYLAGVECDGASYHSSASARDRDKIREAVLRNLGWEIVRIWSTDWFMNPAEAAVRVDQELKGLLEESRSRESAQNIEDNGKQ
jgi:very-short-patch-repair endonuclease